MCAESSSYTTWIVRVVDMEYLLITTQSHQVLQPFMLRRLEKAVATELPGKDNDGVVPPDGVT